MIHGSNHQPQPRSQQAESRPSVRRHHFKKVIPQRTNPSTWFAAVFCAIFGLIIILGGVALLIVYLFYHPQSPHFNISSATLNAAYLDSGSLLNADITILTNFTNPNKKIDVSFHFLVINVYYGHTLIATTSIESFSERRRESKLQNVHMVSSQVPLSLDEAQKIQNEKANNSVAFYVEGLFRTTSHLGTLLHLSYWLHGRCNIVLGGPPTGVIISLKCRTKR